MSVCCLVACVFLWYLQRTVLLSKNVLLLGNLTEVNEDLAVKIGDVSDV